MSQTEKIDYFAARLWHHVCQRGFDASQEDLIASAKEVHAALGDLDAAALQQQIGESLAGLVLKTAVRQYARPHCTTCSKLPSCPATGLEPCESYLRDVNAHKSGRDNLAESMSYLDGVFGIDAQELQIVICRFLDEMGNLH